MKDNKVDRRNFLKIGAVGAAAGAITIPGKVRGKITEKITENVDDLITVHDDFPAEIRSDYKPHSSKDNMFIGAPFHPEDLEANRIHSGEDEQENNYPADREKKGYGRLADALNLGAWALHARNAPMSASGVGNHGVYSWEQGRERIRENGGPEDGEASREPGMEAAGKEDSEQRREDTPDDRYQFSNKEEATNVIKRAAIIYGANLVGITRRDQRWDFSEFVDGEKMMQGRLDECLYGWERFPFEPKTVIVMAFEEDYEATVDS